MENETLIWAEKQARLFQVLTNPHRILILQALIKQERSVGEIAALIGTSIQNTSQHLRIMKERGFLNSRREGQTIFYSIADLQLLKHLSPSIST